jgi:hypothetical protein
MMIAPGGLLLIVPTYINAVPVTVLLVGLPKKKKPAKLRHLILLSRVTYLATMVEMLLQVICQQN